MWASSVYMSQSPVDIWVQGANTNRDACILLAERVADMAHAIFHHTAGQENANTYELTRNIGQIIVYVLCAVFCILFDISFSTLEAIKAFISKQQRRRYINRMLTYAGDGYNLRQLNTRLDNNLALFGVCALAFQCYYI